MRTTEEIKDDIENLENQIYCAERSDNLYATSGRMSANNQRMRELNQELKKAKEK